MQSADGTRKYSIKMDTPDGPIEAPVTEGVWDLPGGPRLVRIIELPGSAYSGLREDAASLDDDDFQAASVTRWEPWEKAQPEERVPLTITDGSGEAWTTDDTVGFLNKLRKVNPAAWQAIRLEMATWGLNEPN